MPKRTDIKSVLLIGSGPITIGQACEFDYSGVQAIRALKEEGIRVILVNSNPATVMTDPAMADRTYIEPLTPSFIAKIIEKEKPDALLPTMGGQTALNLSIELHERGILKKHGVKLIGASVEAITLGEDRQKFRDLMTDNGLDTCRGGFAHNMKEAREIQSQIGYPIIIRPSFTLGGYGGGVANNLEEFETIAHRGLTASPSSQILIEESIIGWKEFELEVIRDRADNSIVVCSIENLDAMGVHTGDSITVAPAQTLTDREVQTLRDISLKVLRLVGVETGGSNVQFALDPKSDRIVVVEMNPRVSRSSALASKATGYPIAKVAAKLALGYTLDELDNEITKITPASFEPSLDYVVVKFPRWAFEKFPKAKSTLSTQMKSVGEVMSIGRGFKEAFLKAVQSLEQGRHYLGRISDDVDDVVTDLLEPSWQRIRAIFRALRSGMSIDAVYRYTHIDPWFLQHFRELADMEHRLSGHTLESLGEAQLWRAKRFGFSDEQVAGALGIEESEVAQLTRHMSYGFKAVDTCAGEFPAETPYLYGTWGEDSDVTPLEGPKVAIIGSGPNRIGQGIEFDYCCVQAVNGFKKQGYKTIMINCNPETVSTDFDVADRLYFEPLTLERVRRVLDFEKPDAVALAFGGQTPLNLAEPLSKHGFNIIGIQADTIDTVEDRKQFAAVVEKIGGLELPANRTANGAEEAWQVARELGYPLMVRPSFVLGGRAMSIVFDDGDMEASLQAALEATPNQPIYIDRFLDDGIEIDVDALCDGDEVCIAGIMQHIEETGIHSGDSSCVMPSPLLTEVQTDNIRMVTRALARELGVVGLLNVQYGIWNDKLYIIEANPRCSRTVPFAAKAIGLPLAELAARVMGGAKLADLEIPLDPQPIMWHVKSPVFPFNKFPGEDSLLGPEMKSTGEVMGNALTYGNAFAKAYRSTGFKLPKSGSAFISLNRRDKEQGLSLARDIYQLGFDLIATSGTGEYLTENGLDVRIVQKLHEGNPNIVDLIEQREVNLIINTPIGKEGHHDDRYIRLAATKYNIPCITTLSAARALVQAIRAIKSERLSVHCVQDLLESK